MHAPKTTNKKSVFREAHLVKWFRNSPGGAASQFLHLSYRIILEPPGWRGRENTADCAMHEQSKLLSPREGRVAAHITLARTAPSPKPSPGKPHPL